MRDEDIIRMANEAGWDAENLEDGFGIRLKRFAELAVKAEREACAAVCDDGAEQMLHAYKREGAARCAAVIRSRR